MNGENTKINEDDATLDTTEKFRRILRLLEKAEPMMRQLANKMNAGHTKQWQETMTDFGKRFWYYDPQVNICDDECFGMSKGSRIFVVNIPVLQLALIRVKGKLKIVRSLYYTD